MTIFMDDGAGTVSDECSSFRKKKEGDGVLVKNAGAWCGRVVENPEFSTNLS